MEKLRNSVEKEDKVIQKLEYIKKLPIQRYVGRHIDMQELKYEEDYLDLYGLINDEEDFSHLVRRRFHKAENFEDFKTQIKNWFKEDINFIFVIKDKEEKPIGTSILYNLNPIKNEIKSSLFLEKESRNSKKTIESYIAILKFIVQILKIDTLKYSVYKDNDYILNMYKKILKDTKEKVDTNAEFETFSLNKEVLFDLIKRLESILDKN